MSAERITAEYLVETPLSLAAAAESMASEQSTGTFTRVPGETDELRSQFAARVEAIDELDPVAAPSLPGAMASQNNKGQFCRGRVKLSFPAANMGANLPTILATVAGNLFELRQLSGVRLLDVDLPATLVREFLGPQFGVSGTRQLTQVVDRPVIGTIIKPSVGLSPAATAQLVRTLAEAGIDFIKDDELMANPPHSPLAERVSAVMEVVHAVADRTGRKVMVAFNITDQLDRMLAHHDAVVAAGGTCVMVSVNHVGLAGVEFLRRRSALPIHGHRNGWGMLSRHAMLGMDFRAYQKFWRLAGVDQIHVNGIQNKFCESDESVVRSIASCLETLPGAGPASIPVMPVVSSGQWGGQAPETYRQTQTTDLMYLAGGGIIGHPGGAAEGVAAIRQAWEAAVAGEPLERYAQTHSELAKSLAFYGLKAAFATTPSGQP